MADEYVYSSAGSYEGYSADDAGNGAKGAPPFALGEGDVKTEHIDDAAITSAKIGIAQIVAAHISDASIRSAAIMNLAVTNAKIDDAAITTAKIADAQITTAKIGNAQITTALIADAQITNAKIDRASANKLQIVAADIVGAAIQTAHIGDAQITNAKIDRASVNKLTVVTADIANAAITNAKIDRATANKLVVVSADIQDSAIVNAKIGNAEITGAKIAGATIDTANIKTGAITTALIGNAAVDTAQLKDASITDAKIVELTATKITSGTLNTGQVTIQGIGSKLRITGNRVQVFDGQAVPVERVSMGDVNGDGSVYGFLMRGADGVTVLMDINGVKSAGITDGAITNPKIGNGAVENNNILVNSVTADRLVANTITAREIQAATITANKMVAGTITAASGIIADAAITNAKIANVDAAKITSGFIDAARIQAGTIDAAALKANTVIASDIVFTGKLQGASGTFSGKIESINPAGYLSYMDTGLIVSRSADGKQDVMISNGAVAITYDDPIYSYETQNLLSTSGLKATQAQRVSPWADLNYGLYWYSVMELGAEDSVSGKTKWKKTINQYQGFMNEVWAGGASGYDNRQSRSYFSESQLRMQYYNSSVADRLFYEMVATAEYISFRDMDSAGLATTNNYLHSDITSGLLVSQYHTAGGSTFARYSQLRSDIGLTIRENYSDGTMAYQSTLTNGELRFMFNGATTMYMNANQIWTDDVWTNVTPTNGFTNYSTSFHGLGYYKDITGLVSLRGLIGTGTGVWSSATTSACMQLPVGYRPTKSKMFNCIGQHNSAVPQLFSCRVQIEPTGYVLMYASGGVTSANAVQIPTWCSLEGIVFDTQS